MKKSPNEFVHKAGIELLNEIRLSEGDAQEGFFGFSWVRPGHGGWSINNQKKDAEKRHRKKTQKKTRKKIRHKNK